MIKLDFYKTEDGAKQFWGDYFWRWYLWNQSIYVYSSYSKMVKEGIQSCKRVKPRGACFTNTVQISIYLIWPQWDSTKVKNQDII